MAGRRNRGSKWLKSQSKSGAGEPKPARLLLIQRHVLDLTHSKFLSYWKRRQEGVAYWFGKKSVSDLYDVVLAVVVPKAYHSSGNYEVPVEETTRMGHMMLDVGLTCLAQIHTHPPGVRQHSGYDDEHAISTSESFLSLVFQDYGNIRAGDLEDITVHERRSGQWVVLGDEAKRQRIMIVEDDVDLRVGDLESRPRR